jgi:hypothetical protein
LAREFNISGWQISAFEDLIKSDAPLTMEDVHMLGIETVLCVTHLRERHGNIIRSAVSDVAMAQVSRLQGYQAKLESLKSTTEVALNRTDHLIEDLRTKYVTCANLTPNWGSRQYNVAEGQLRLVRDQHDSLWTRLLSDIEDLQSAHQSSTLSREALRDHFDLTDDD